MTTPKPKHIETVCTVCGLDWKRHGAKPTIEKCVELLKKDLATKAAPVQPFVPQPYPVPYPVYPRPYRPWQPYTPYWQTIGAGTAGTTYSISAANATSVLPNISGVPLGDTKIGKAS